LRPSSSKPLTSESRAQGIALKNQDKVTKVGLIYKDRAQSENQRLSLSLSVNCYHLQIDSGAGLLSSHIAGKSQQIRLKAQAQTSFNKALTQNSRTRNSLTKTLTCGLRPPEKVSGKCQNRSAKHLQSHEPCQNPLKTEASGSTKSRGKPRRRKRKKPPHFWSTTIPTDRALTPT
jgi:hypothetical protein